MTPADASRPRAPLSERILGVAARLEDEARRPRGIAVIALALAIYGVAGPPRRMGDYDVYLRAAERAVTGEEVYRLDDAHRYLYAPILVFLFVPLIPVPPVIGKLVWFALNVWIVASVVRLSGRLVLGDARAPPGFVALVIVLSLRFIDNNIGHGQINLFMLWLMLQAYVLAGRQRFALAGLSLAGAIAAKIVPAVLLVPLILGRQWRFALAAVAGFAVLMVLPWVWWQGEYGAVLESWFEVVVDQAGHYEMGNKINQSIAAFPYRLFRPYPDGSPLVVLPPAVVTAITLALHFAFVVPLLWVSARLGGKPRTPEGPSADELSLYLLYVTVAAPYSWKYYFANLILPFAAVVRRLWTPDRGLAARALWAVFFLNFLPGERLFGKRMALLFQQWSLHFLAVVVLFIFILWGAARDRGNPATRSS